MMVMVMAVGEVVRMSLIWESWNFNTESVTVTCEDLNNDILSNLRFLSKVKVPLQSKLSVSSYFYSESDLHCAERCMCRV